MTAPDGLIRIPLNEEGGSGGNGQIEEFLMQFNGEGIQHIALLTIYGAGIVSSASESRFCLESHSPHRLGFDLARVMRTRYRIDDFQQTYFVLDRLDDLLRLADIDFAPLYEQVRALEPLAPDAVLPQDTVITRGDGHYHRRRALELQDR